MKQVKLKSTEEAEDRGSETAQIKILNETNSYDIFFEQWAFFHLNQIDWHERKKNNKKVKKDQTFVCKNQYDMNNDMKIKFK